MEYLLFICLFGSVYSYAIYPLILLILPKSHQSAPDFSAALPQVDLIITVHNEQQRIEEKLNNALALDYPAGKLTILVASDGSTDETNTIVNRYANQGIKLVEVTDHKGKENAQLQAINTSESEIIVFSDVATSMEPDALQNLAAYFSNERVGAVSSEDRFISDSGEIAGEGLYVKYEMWLRQLESERAGLVGLGGSFFAVRRNICDNWDIYSPSDFNTALQCNAHGKIAVTSNKVLGYYKDLKDPQKEYNRKVRTVLRGITALFRHLDALNIFEKGLFAFQVLSHKVMRWLVPWFLTGTAVLTALLVNSHWFFMLLGAGQIGFYSIALLGWKNDALQKKSAVRIIFFFVQVNVSVAHAAIKYILGNRMVTWTPSARR